MHTIRAEGKHLRHSSPKFAKRPLKIENPLVLFNLALPPLEFRVTSSCQALRVADIRFLLEKAAFSITVVAGCAKRVPLLFQTKICDFSCPILS